MSNAIMPGSTRDPSPYTGSRDRVSWVGLSCKIVLELLLSILKFEKTWLLPVKAHALTATATILHRDQANRHLYHLTMALLDPYSIDASGIYHVSGSIPRGVQ